MRTVAVAEFGKDHWSLLAYVETRCVDAAQGMGRLERSRMRCNPQSHPLLSAGAPWRAHYGSRLRGFFDFEQRSDPEKAAAAGLLLLDHDDWDCLDDLQAAGLLQVQSLANPCVSLTPAGVRVSAALRAHKLTGGQFATFVASPELWAPADDASAALPSAVSLSPT